MFIFFMKVPFFYDGGRGDLGVKGGTRHVFTYSLETVGEFYATGGEEGVGSDATPSFITVLYQFIYVISPFFQQFFRVRE
jgi:hypothetical protein